MVARPMMPPAISVADDLFDEYLRETDQA